MNLLQLGYLIDVCVSLPVGWAMLTNNRSVLVFFFGEPLRSTPCAIEPLSRSLLGTLWMSIAVGSIVGLMLPIVCAPVLVLQWIYKSLWLIAFAGPRWWNGSRAEVPNRLAGIFVAYVLAYPWIIPWSQLVGS